VLGLTADQSPVYSFLGTPIVSPTRLTTSQADQDILHSYDLGANCDITKLIDLERLTTVVQAIENFWFTVVKLPPR
jgi:hypothetical protein